MSKELDLNRIFPVFKSSLMTIERISPLCRFLPIIGLYHQSDNPGNAGKSEDNWNEEIKRITKEGEVEQFRYALVELEEFKDEPTDKYKKCSYVVRMSSGCSHLGIAGVVSRELAKTIVGCTPFFYQTRHEDPATIANIVRNFKDGRTYETSYAKVIGAGFVTISGKDKKIFLYGRSRAFSVNYDNQKKYELGMTCHEFMAEIFKHKLHGWEIMMKNNLIEAEGVEIPSFNSR